MLTALAAVLGLALAAWLGSQTGLQMLLGFCIPALSAVLLAGGLIWKLLRWALTPVPFSIPTTGGQERSLPWIRHARLDAPATWAGVT